MELLGSHTIGSEPPSVKVAHAMVGPALCLCIMRSRDGSRWQILSPLSLVTWTLFFPGTYTSKMSGVGLRRPDIGNCTDYWGIHTKYFKLIFK